MGIISEKANDKWVFGSQSPKNIITPNKHSNKKKEVQKNWDADNQLSSPSLLIPSENYNLLKSYLQAQKLNWNIKERIK